MQNFNAAKRERGFTLLEVVVAMTIVGLGIVTALEIFSLGLRLATRSADISQARLDAQTVMDEALVYGSSPAQESGSFASGNRWRMRTAALGDSSLSLGSPWELKEINLEVSYDRTKRLEFKTLRLAKKTNP